MSATMTRKFSSAFSLILAAELAGCMRPDPTVGDCGPIIQRYLSENLARTEAHFESYDFETQYSILICGSQATHPPALFGDLLARGGEPTATLLAAKLRSSEFDPTIADIISVYRSMKVTGTYDPASDPALVSLMQSRVASIETEVLREFAEEDLAVALSSQTE